MRERERGREDGRERGRDVREGGREGGREMEEGEGRQKEWRKTPACEMHMYTQLHILLEGSQCCSLQASSSTLQFHLPRSEP